ncbi:MAG: hypothetical protein B6U95_00375 [Thermofilum sp. ex4484_82]|nr:MAG: hypothetical protein B6U95_00375 [Thermofilum sp. ex4484_82]OYT40071.1 MAG: hypothetical protein B6U96_00380 [Archaeoglobales archaeon ex4484_92]
MEKWVTDKSRISKKTGEYLRYIVRQRYPRTIGRLETFKKLFLRYGSPRENFQDVRLEHPEIEIDLKCIVSVLRKIKERGSPINIRRVSPYVKYIYRYSKGVYLVFTIGKRGVRVRAIVPEKDRKGKEIKNKRNFTIGKAVMLLFTIFQRNCLKRGREIIEEYYRERQRMKGLKQK